VKRLSLFKSSHTKKRKAEVWKGFNPFIGSRAFKFHLYSGRIFKECKSKKQVLQIIFYIKANNNSWQLFRTSIRIYVWNHFKFLHTCSVIFFVWYSPKHVILQSGTPYVEHINLVSFLHLCGKLYTFSYRTFNFLLDETWIILCFLNLSCGPHLDPSPAVIHMAVLSVLLMSRLGIHCLCYLSHLFFLLALSFSEESSRKALKA